MRLSRAKELFRQLTAGYFAGATVIFAKQSRVAKTDLPLVTITTGNVKRSRDSVNMVADGTNVSSYPSRISITIDLFTHGAPVTDENGRVFAYENTALDDMLCFADFIGSQHTQDWCNLNDISLLIDGEVQDLTGLVNDNNYEYRSRMNVVLYFTQNAVGAAAVLSEASLQYRVGGTGDNPVYSPDKPRKAFSTTGFSYEDMYSEGVISQHIPDHLREVNPVVIPTPLNTSSGGGSADLAAEETGYFSNDEIKEEIGNE